MAHLTPFIAIVVVATLVSDRGLSAARSAIGVAVDVARGLGEHLRALGRRYARLAAGP